MLPSFPVQVRTLFAVVIFHTILHRGDAASCKATGTCPTNKKGAGASLLQLRKALVGGFGSNATCSDLMNHGTHFTVDIEVGSPGQKFSVVADTGSNSLIIPSCVCQQRGYCSKSDRCFIGTNKSSSFMLKDDPKSLQSVFITFGSGTIEAIVAKEKVSVGHLSVDMGGGILLMVARNLNIVGKFEGILGLGLPAGPSKMSPRTHQKHHSKASETSAQIEDMMKKIVGGIFGGDKEAGNLAEDERLVAESHASHGEDVEGEATVLPWQAETQLSSEVPEGVDEIGDMIDTLDSDKSARAKMSNSARLPGAPEHGIMGWGTSMRAHNEQNPQEVGPKGLLEQAGISRFSMCFNDGASGVLNLNIPEMPIENKLGSVGKFHWGLDFRGISIGEQTMPLSFCSSENMTNGQDTPCGAIPDSGTTVIMAPKEHLSILLDSICDSWPRCAQNYTAMIKAAEAAKAGATAEYSWDPFEIAPAAKSSVLQLLLLDCGSWLNDTSGLGELPNLKFHMAGAGGNEKLLELPGWAYVLESSRDVAEDNNHLQGMDPSIMFLQNQTVRSNKVCSPAFGAIDYNTQKNGPVWILGTPFFYQFHVGYDLNSAPPAISFTSVETTPCVNCGQQASLLASSSTLGASKRAPRWINGRVRMPDLDTNLPL